MGFFSKLFGSSPSGDPRFNMAKEIVDKLGEEKRTYSASLALGGGYYQDHVYEGYGLKIVKPDYRHGENTDVYVNFNGQRVLDRKTYIPGSWEDVFNELYQDIGIILNERQRESNLLAHENSLLIYLCQILGEGEIDIGNGVTINATHYTFGYYDEHDGGTNYQVYYNGNLVFSAYRGTIYKDDSYSHYEPGNWENILREYVDYSKYRKDIIRQQQNDNYASENIKKLRKLREKKY